MNSSKSHSFSTGAGGDILCCSQAPNTGARCQARSGELSQQVAFIGRQSRRDLCSAPEALGSRVQWCLYRIAWIRPVVAARLATLPSGGGLTTGTPAEMPGSAEGQMMAGPGSRAGSRCQSGLTAGMQSARGAGPNPSCETGRGVRPGAGGTRPARPRSAPGTRRAARASARGPARSCRRTCTAPGAAEPTSSPQTSCPRIGPGAQRRGGPC